MDRRVKNDKILFLQFSITHNLVFFGFAKIFDFDLALQVAILKLVPYF